jgi:hypothetical protein
MYGWIWRSLPGGTALRLLQALLLVALVSAVLLFVVFPWLEPRLPANPLTGPVTVSR